MSMPTDAEIERKMLTRLAEMLSEAPKSMAWVISRYKEIERVDDAYVQQLLRINSDDFYHLAICGRPREYLFAEDIETLSERFNIPQEPLARLVRRVDALVNFREYSEVDGGTMLAAARDIAEELETPYQPGEETPKPAPEQDEPADDEQ